MTHTISLVFLILLSSGLAFGARTNIFSGENEHQASPFATVAADGICSLRVAIYGYPCEEHTVRTEDGYILSMQRIPTGLSGQNSGDRPPVLLQHGLLMDGITWLLNSPDESLAYILADGGFDVWIANTRGSKYSRGRTSLSPDDSPYWDWSWDELVSFELSATVQYVHDQTSQKLHYIGHSLGTLIALAAACHNEQLDMLRSAALLSPIAYLSQVYSALVQDAAKSFLFESLSWLGLAEFDPNSKAVEKLLELLCKDPDVHCFNLMNSFTGTNCCLNSSSVDVFLENEPQATATKNIIHLAQMIRRGTIAKFDYDDDDKNMKYYGQTTPPVYNMTRTPNDFPLFLSYGGADALSDVNDVQTLLANLKDHDGDKLVVQYLENYAHADFVMAVNAKKLVYNPIMAFFRLQ